MSLNTPFFRMLISAVGALLVYGLWAFFANWEQGSTAAIQAFSAQGFTSFSSALVTASIIESLYKMMPALMYKVSIGLMIFLVSCYHVGGHLIAQTPNLWLTVAPVLILGNAYNLAYAFFIARKAQSIKDVDFT